LTKDSKIADHTASAAPEQKSIIIDLFCGVGGNTIAFALSGRWKRVYAIEKNDAALACAKHNAEIYGVADRITFFQGDCFELLGLDEAKQDNAVLPLQTVVGTYGVVFASPPWGGQ
jgi:trimethylguanosine synthase